MQKHGRRFCSFLMRLNQFVERSLTSIVLAKSCTQLTHACMLEKWIINIKLSVDSLYYNEAYGYKVNKIN